MNLMLSIDFKNIFPPKNWVKGQFTKLLKILNKIGDDVKIVGIIIRNFTLL